MDFLLLFIFSKRTSKTSNLMIAFVPWASAVASRGLSSSPPAVAGRVASEHVRRGIAGEFLQITNLPHSNKLTLPSPPLSNSFFSLRGKAHFYLLLPPGFTRLLRTPFIFSSEEKRAKRVQGVVKPGRKGVLSPFSSGIFEKKMEACEYIYIYI